MEFLDSIFAYFDDLNKRQKELDIIDAARNRGPGGGPTDAIGNTAITIPEWLAGLRSPESASKIGDQVTADNITREINEVKKANPTLDLTPNISKKEDESNLDFARRKKAAQGLNLKIETLKANNPHLDYSGVSGSDLGKLENFTKFQNSLIEAKNQGYDVTGVTDAAGLKRVKAEQDLSDRNRTTEGSVEWQTQRQDREDDVTWRENNADRNFNLSVTQLENQNSQAIAALQAQIETAKLQNEQSILDREYLDRRDLRDYNYKIKRDKQESLDKIFALLLGGIDNMF